MVRLTSDEQLEQFWADVIDRGPNPPTRTVDRWGDVFTIFESWGDVEDLYHFAYENLPPEVIAVAPAYDTNKSHQIEWAIGEFGFTDQFSTCDHCYTAIQTDDMHPHFYVDYDQGFFLCGDCLKNHRDFADDYLSFLAGHIADDQTAGVMLHFVNPCDHGFVDLNFHSICATRHDPPGLAADHPEYDSRLTWANEEEIKLLGRAAAYIDPNVQIVYAYTQGYSGGVRYFARFNPNEHIEYPGLDDDGFYGRYSAGSEDINGIVLGYVLGLIFAKFGKLYSKRGAK